VKIEYSIGLIISLSLAGCMSTPVKQEDARECVQNFSKQGLMNYRTSVTLRGVNQELAMNRLVRELGRKGFSVNQNDPAKGYVNANFDAGQSGLQLSAFIDKSGVNSKVEMNYKGTGASLASLFVSDSAYMNELCDFAEAMSQATLDSKQNNSTPTSGATQTNIQSAPTANASTQASKGISIRDAQRTLRELGYDPGPIDGTVGGKTSAALKLFQADSGLPVTGQLDVETAALLNQRASQGGSRKPSGTGSPKQPDQPSLPKETQPPREKKAVTDL